MLRVAYTRVHHVRAHSSTVHGFRASLPHFWGPSCARPRGFKRARVLCVCALPVMLTQQTSLFLGQASMASLRTLLLFEAEGSLSHAVTQSVTYCMGYMHTHMHAHMQPAHTRIVVGQWITHTSARTRPHKHTDTSTPQDGKQQQHIYAIPTTLPLEMRGCVEDTLTC